MLAAFLLLQPLLAAANGNLVWERWQHLPGVFDVAGPLPDGSLLVATANGLFLLKPATAELSPAHVALTAPAGGAEDYIDFSQGLGSSEMGCSFPTPAVYVLRTASPPAVLRVDMVGGGSSTFATVGGVDTLSGIAFDRFGRFGNRLLVIGPHAGQTVVDAIDCNGKVSVITTSAPRMEGGMEVAPPGFGSYSGDLVVPDEYSGNIFAVTPEGTVRVLAASGLPVGGDIGVESAGFVPFGFFRGGAAYLADRATANNPHPGTDTLLRLRSSALQSEGVSEGDLLVATEGGGDTIVVHCPADGSCAPVRHLGQATAGAHGEGHLLLVADNPTPSPQRLPQGKLGAAREAGLLSYLPFVAGLVLVTAILLYLGRRRRSRDGPGS
ncbi:MAG: hypothetical protein M3Z98_00930 [Candidatus Dormibacteraeota bacterium]|nr:hypothetical protein [Candidatus Dormibacteraeota bacterium]